jgi:hypothetical protein
VNASDELMGVGTRLAAAEPLPSWPKSLLPQQSTAPAATPQVWAAPALSEVMP